MMSEDALTDEDLAQMFPDYVPAPRLPSADEIVAEQKLMPPASSPVTPVTHSVASASKGGVVIFADDHTRAPTLGPTVSSISGSPELVELRAIRKELEALNGFMATAINKMGRR